MERRALVNLILLTVSDCVLSAVMSSMGSGRLVAVRTGPSLEGPVTA